MNKNTQDLIGRILALEEMVILVIRALPPAQRREIGFLAEEMSNMVNSQPMSYEAMGIWDRQEFHRSRLLNMMNAENPPPAGSPGQSGSES